MTLARNERGQVTPLVAALVVVMGVMALVLGHLGRAATDRARARTAADAAALAGAAEGHAAADELARANSAQLVDYDEDGSGSVTVVVRLGTAHAQARAQLIGGMRWCEAPVRGHPVHFEPCQPRTSR